MNDDVEILRENSPDVLLTVRDEYKSSPIPLNLGKEGDVGDVEVGGVLNLKGDELRNIPTSTSIPKLDNLKIGSNQSSILEIGFDTEYVTNSSSMKKLKNSIKYDSKELRDFLKEKNHLLLNDDDEGNEKQIEDFINSKGLNYLISY